MLDYMCYVEHCSVFFVIVESIDKNKWPPDRLLSFGLLRYLVLLCPASFISLVFYVRSASSCVSMYSSSCFFCFIVSSIGLNDCEAIALIGYNGVMSTACPRNKNFPHTCCMNFLPFLSSSGAVNCCVAYCLFATYLIGVPGYGWCCFFVVCG